MNPRHRKGRAGAAGSVRIVGGRWRGTRLAVVDRPGLRPSSDRVRETLFNWLQFELAGARVLDLFAGSGALGLEAVSRGAAWAQLVELDPEVVRGLSETVGKLGAAAEVGVQRADALAFLESWDGKPFDIVFVDPPFAAGLWPAVLAALPRVLAPKARLYLESPLDLRLDPGPEWVLHRENHTREVRFALYRRATLGTVDT